MIILLFFYNLIIHYYLQIVYTLCISKEPWQPQNKKVFPAVIVITDTRYKIDSPYIKFYQVPEIGQLVNMFEPKQEGIKIKVG